VIRPKNGLPRRIPRLTERLDMTARLYDASLSATRRAYREDASQPLVVRLLTGAIEAAIDDATQFDARLDAAVVEALAIVAARYSEGG